MIHIRKTLTVILATLVLVSLSTSIAFAQDPDNGKQLWEGQIWQCSRCHGANGEGVFGATLAGTEKTADEFIAQVRNPRNRMPMFSEDQVSDDQIRDIQAYMASLPKPATPGFKQIELPEDAPEGQKLIVEKRCVACHGETGIENNRFGRGEAVPTAELVIHQLRMPFKNMPSFSEGQVSDAEAALIAEFQATQIPPGDLPQSGDAGPTRLPMTLAIAGLALLTVGFSLWQLKVRA